MGKKKDKSLRMSIPEKQMLYGIEIVKMPIGRYVSALSSLEKLPGIIADELMTGSEDLSEVLEKLLKGDRDIVESIFYSALIKVPQELCGFIAELLDIPAERLLKDLTPNQLCEILIAMWEVNDVSDFFMNVRRLRELTARTSVLNSGFKDGSQ